MCKRISIYKLPYELSYVLNIKNWYINMYKTSNLEKYYKVNLPSYIFFKLELDRVKFLFVDKFRFRGFLRHFANNISKFYKIYYFRMWFKGMGYEFREITCTLFQFFFAKNILIYIHVPRFVTIKYIENQIFFGSTNLSELKKIVGKFLLLRKHAIYELSGIFYPGYIIMLKPGKVKIR